MRSTLAGRHLYNARSAAPASEKPFWLTLGWARPHLADLAASVALNRAVVKFFFFQTPPLQAVGVGHLADLAAGVALWPLKPPLQAGGVKHLADLADLDRAVVNFSKPPLQAGGVGHLADLADLSELGGACEERC